MKITAITREARGDGPRTFRIDDALYPDGPIVKSILWCRKGPNNGAKSESPAYVLVLENADGNTVDERLVIEAHTVIDWAYVNGAKKVADNDPEAAVNLPE